MGDRLLRLIDADNLGGHIGEQGAAVAFAAGRIEHALAAREGQYRTVAMPMLVPDFAWRFRREALACEFEGLGFGCGLRQHESLVDRRGCARRDAKQRLLSRDYRG